MIDNEVFKKSVLGTFSQNLKLNCVKKYFGKKSSLIKIYLDKKYNIYVEKKTKSIIDKINRCNKEILNVH